MNMKLKREGSWTNKEDVILAETVLKHIRKSSTQLMAFEEVGEIIGRTAAACGFRWNGEVRHKYKTAIKLAKKARLESKKSVKTPSINNGNTFNKEAALKIIKECEAEMKKQALLINLTDVLEMSDNEQVIKIMENAIEFIKKH